MGLSQSTWLVCSKMCANVSTSNTRSSQSNTKLRMKDQLKYEYADELHKLVEGYFSEYNIDLIFKPKDWEGKQ